MDAERQMAQGNFFKKYIYFYLFMYFNGLPRWCSGKQSTCQCRRCKRHGLRTLHWENPLEEEMATHPSILAWRMPWTEEPGGLQYCCCCCQVTLVVSDSVRPHRWQPTRFPCPWDSPGKSTGVGCHFLLQCMNVKSESESEVVSNSQ